MSDRDYLYSIRYLFLLSLTLFLVSAVSGYLLSERVPVGGLEMLREVFGGVEEWHPLWLMAFIFLNNSVKSLLVILFGIVFGIAPLLFIVLNGFIIGLVTFEVERLNGLPFALAAILPHGVIEIPTVLLSSAIGIRMGCELVNKMRGRGSIRRELGRGIRFFTQRILPFLLLAAIVEVFITPLALYFFQL